MSLRLGLLCSDPPGLRLNLPAPNYPLRGAARSQGPRCQGPSPAPPASRRRGKDEEGPSRRGARVGASRRPFLFPWRAEDVRQALAPAGGRRGAPSPRRRASVLREVHESGLERDVFPRGRVHPRR